MRAVSIALAVAALATASPRDAAADQRQAAPSQSFAVPAPTSQALPAPSAVPPIPPPPAPPPDYAPPPGPYAAPPRVAPEPPRLSEPLMITGLVTIAVGGVMLAGGIIATVEACVISCGHHDPTAARAVSLVGGLLILVGIPAALAGGQRVKRAVAATPWMGEPGGAGWIWRF